MSVKAKEGARPMIGREPLLEIIIPNWNGKDMLAHCLASLRRQTFTDFGVIVVDNGSEDGSIGMLRSLYPEVRLISLKENTGFSIAVNKGIEASVAPWLLLLNNDMEVAEDCLANLCQALGKYPDFHMFALKMMNYHHRRFIDGAGDAVLRGGVGYRIGTLEEDSHVYQYDRETFGACAGAALYAREFFNKVGLFDTDFFAYLEDVDLNLRGRRHGFRCMFLASAIVFHIGSASSGSKINELTIRLSTRNTLFVLAKNYPLSMFLLFLPAIIVYQIAWLLFCVKKGMFQPYLCGLYQGLRLGFPFYKKGTVLRQEESLLPLRDFATMIKVSEREAVNSIMARRIAAGKSNVLLSCYCKLFFS
jgi:GT2 family glycosyltransferase